jgi:hypothetical protein
LDENNNFKKQLVLLPHMNKDSELKIALLDTKVSDIKTHLDIIRPLTFAFPVISITFFIASFQFEDKVTITLFLILSFMAGFGGIKLMLHYYEEAQLLRSLHIDKKKEIMKAIDSN